ncbi:peroxiredoxin [Dactylosporangium sp. CA-139114]|uniref:peroxiredoxin n=1 Tax=Dactylosporangium sp. CA-139114 TaxID=3239931 RepID=UPI003D99A01F
MQVGDVVEDFELPDETGTPRRLSTLLEGGPVVLFFYPAALTAGCTREACHFRDMAGELREAGGQPVGISGDEVAKQAEFASRHSLGYPLLSDPVGTVREQFGVKRGLGGGLVPTKRATFVIDTDRRVLAVVKSEIRMDVHADKALEALQARSS